MILNLFIKPSVSMLGSNQSSFIKNSVKNSKKIADEFKQFAIKGNILDLAIGVMIGTAFNKIVTSLVNDIIMPPIGWLTGGVRFDNYKWVLKERVTDQAGKVIQEAITVNYGVFIQVLVDFIIIALTMFVVVKAMARIRENHASKEKQQPPAPPEEILLLREIRDELKK